MRAAEPRRPPNRACGSRVCSRPLGSSPRGSDPAPSQIADDHAPPSDAIELGDEGERARVIEMMKKLGAKDDIDTMVSQR